MCQHDNDPAAGERERVEKNLEQIRQYAWDWFSYHAGQRISMFNYSLAAAGLLAAGYATVLEKSTIAAAAIGFVGGIVTLSFVFLDRRNHQLVDYGHDALKAVERSLFADSAVPGSALAKLKMPNGIHNMDAGTTTLLRDLRAGRHRIFLPLVEALLAVVFFAGGFTAAFAPGVFDGHSTAVEKSDVRAVADNLKIIGDKLH